MTNYQLKTIEPADSESPFVQRLRHLADLSEDEAAQVQAGMQAVRRVPQRAILVGESEASPATRVVQRGWAARARLLADGRRQILELLVPGDVIKGIPVPMAFSQETIVAITELEVATIDPAIFEGDALTLARDRSRALVLSYLYNQVTRLGRQTAYERLAHLLLELRDRLTLAGQGDANGFAMPLTQETLADILGLTTVHMNRTMQQLRREGMIEGSRNGIVLLQTQALASIADYSTPRF